MSIQRDDGLLFKVKVQPGASKNEVMGFSGDTLRIKLTAHPEKGKANEQLIEFLAEKLQVKKRGLGFAPYKVSSLHCVQGRLLRAPAKRV